MRDILLALLLVGLAFPARGAEEAMRRILEEESSVMEELERIEEEARQARRLHLEAEEEAVAAKERAGRARQEEEEAERRLREVLEGLRPRLLHRYRLLQRGRGGMPEDPARALRIARGLERLLASDLELVRSSREAHRLRREAKVRQEEAERIAGELAEAAAARREEAEGALSSREELLRRIRGERRALEKAHREVAASRQRLESRLGRAKGDGGFGKVRGALPWPVAGAVVEVPFGKVVNAKFGTVTFQNGIDLRAPEGTEIVAVGKGKVAFAGWFRGYGNLVIVDHGGHHSLYGHLGAIAVEAGADVDAGQRLGAVGDTGSMKGPFLYFELREDGRPVDPLPWFRRG